MASKPIRHGHSAAAIIAALLLPPFGVFLTHGLGLVFWIAVGLTCIGFIPGAVFALAMVLKPELASALARRRPAVPQAGHIR